MTGTGSVQIRLDSTSGILDLLGTLISSSSLRVRQVQFQVNLQPTGSNPCSCDTATPEQIDASVNAFLNGRGYVTPQDVKSIGPDVLRHRIIVSYEAEAEAVTSETIIERIFAGLPVP